MSSLVQLNLEAWCPPATLILMVKLITTPKIKEGDLCGHIRG